MDAVNLIQVSGVRTSGQTLCSSRLAEKPAVNQYWPAGIKTERISIDIYIYCLSHLSLRPDFGYAGAFKTSDNGE